MRYKLLPLDIEDAAECLHIVNNPDVTKNFAKFQEPITLAKETVWIAKMQESDTDFVFKMVDDEDPEKILGIVGIHQIYKPSANGRLGIIIGNPGQGLGPVALDLICHVAFNTLGLNKVWVMFFKANERMLHITNSKGFQVEGVLRQEYVDHTGVFQDMIRTSLLAEDYKNDRKT